MTPRVSDAKVVNVFLSTPSVMQSLIVSMAVMKKNPLVKGVKSAPKEPSNAPTINADQLPSSVQGSMDVETTAMKTDVKFASVTNP